MEKERIAVVTGSTGGLGGLVAWRLAETGWDLILLDRMPAKQEKVLTELKAAFPAQNFVGKRINLMDLRTVHEVVAELKREMTSLDALWNISGLLTDKRQNSNQNLEGHFAVNTVAPYALMKGLRPLLAEGAKETAAYIVNFTTEGGSGVKNLQVETLANPSKVGGLFGAYSTSKAALHTIGVALSDELKKENILIHAVDPGATKTSMTNGNKAMPWIIRMIRPLMFQAPEKQAAKLMTAVEKAVSMQQTNLFISNGKQKKHPPLVYNKKLQASLRTLLDKLSAAG